ncbi:MAG: ABC transporter ATP-binding protein [Promethearchaeia archaeon]
MKNEVIRLENIDKFYYSGVATQVLFGINLKINEGEFCSIIGPSGSGKSTLMNIIGTLDKPTEGKLYIDQKRTDKMNEKELSSLRNQTIGFVFQFHYLLPEFTAIENVLMPFRISDQKVTKEVKERGEELLKLMGIHQVKDNLTPNMSGGQQQRTAVARALMNNPKILLADEPTGNLDSEATDNVYELFREINKKYKTSIITITHDRKIAERTDRIIELRDGKIVLDVEK